MDVKDFVAIDFETFTPERTSACAIGMVKVQNGAICQKFYSLINPIPDNRDTDNSAVHGITKEMLIDAPTFEQLFPFMVEFIGELPIVSHNVDVDIRIFAECMAYYSLKGINLDNHYCTYRLNQKSLEACCEEYGIEMGRHHDALDDATACAHVFLSSQGKIYYVPFTGGIRSAMATKGAKKYEKSTLQKLEDDEIENKDTIFFHSSVVITGTFIKYPDRNELGKMLRALGADINTSISSKTTIVVMGNGAGPAKMKKVEDLRAKGNDIRVINEQELIKLLQ